MVDEYVQTSGIVAIEDILEEIVGNIEDEHDEEESFIMEEADGSIHMDGMTGFEDVVECLKLPLEGDEFETLNGFLISLMEKIPSDGERAVLHAYGYCFDIRDVKDKIIRKVVVTKDEGSDA